MAKAPAKDKENEFDERREGLIVERKTIWPKDVSVVDAERPSIADKLHRDPKNAKKLVYVRCPTGFIRQITVTSEDLDRLKGA